MILFAILTKELRAYFGLFLAYTVVAVALSLSGFFFYTDLSFFMLWGGTDLEKGLWEFVFHDLRFVLLLLVPVLTARSFAEEKKLGTLDLLWTYPIPEGSVLLGKFLAAATLLVVVLGLTLLYPLMLSWYYPGVNWPPLAAGYTGLLLLGLVFISVGLFLSALTDSQAVAAMGTLGVLVLFWSLTWNEQAVNEVLLSTLLQLSLFDRFYNFARGAIDTQEITFFLIFVVFFLLLTWQALRSRRWRGKGEFSSLDTFLATPSRRQWVVVGAIDALVLASLIGIQAFSIRHNLRWDLSPTKTLSLSQQTRDVLRTLDRDVQLTLFFGGTPDTYQGFEDLFKRYAAETPHFQYRILYRDRNLGLAQEYGATHYGATAIEYNSQRKLLPLPTEELITQALFQFQHGHKQNVYFVGGHGENDPRSNQPQEGYSEAAAALENENFVVRPLQLARGAGVPDDAALVVISGPRADLLPEELAALDAYVQKGGHLLLMIDPMVAPNLTAFLARYGITLAEDLVYDPENRLFGGDALSPIVSLYNTGVPIVKDFHVNTIFSLARSVEPIEPSPSPAITAAPFCRTGPGSWARFSPTVDAPSGALEFEGTKARPGPISLAVAATINLDSQANGKAEASAPSETPGRTARIVVYGDSDFASNARLSLLGNKDLFLNTVQWLAGEEQLITQRPKDEEVAPKLSNVYLTARESRILFWLAAVVEPSLVLVIGAVVAVYRRRKV
ncbi:MAG: Gldg family protein [Deltaproteobacteria bacterium]|nr:Gldg family protein [Deltaproteobacteria bacterium]